MKHLPFSPPSRWVKEDFYITGEKYFDRIRDEIDRAQKTIDIEVYIFEFGRLGHELVDRLNRAATRGVKVRLLIDGIGSLGSVEIIRAQFQQMKAEVSVYHPVLPIGLLSWFSYLNQRNHRKTWIFDDQTVCVSSCNVSDVHMHDPLGKNVWIDYGLVVEGHNLYEFRQNFEDAWRGKFVKHRKSDLVSFLSLSKRRIWIGTPYFVPTLRQLRALIRASRQGVQVKILISRKSDLFFMPWLMTTYYTVLLRSGIEVYQYDQTVFHGKVLIVDDWFRIGTSNFNHRSFLHDLEADIMITHQENQRRIEDDLSARFYQSTPVSFEQLQKVSSIQRLIARFFLLFKFWF